MIFSQATCVPLQKRLLEFWKEKRVHMFSHFFLPTSKSISPFSVRSEMKLSRKREFCRNTIQYDGQISQATSEKKWDVKRCRKRTVKKRHNGLMTNSGWEKKHAVLWPNQGNGPCYFKTYYRKSPNLLIDLLVAETYIGARTRETTGNGFVQGFGLWHCLFRESPESMVK